jgi:DnaJ homolog subfamily A member 2
LAKIRINNSAGDVKVIKGQGMPSPRHHDFGNLYIQFDVKFPEKHFQNPDVLKGLDAILPPRNPVNIPADAMTDDAALEDVDPKQQARMQAGGGMMDEDDEEGGQPRGETMQCASQ